MPEPKLHAWRIDSREYQRQAERRGRIHAFERIDPRRTALVVIDMISFFVEQSAYCLGIVPNIALLAGAVRSGGGTVAWVRPAERHRYPQRMVEFFGEEVASLYEKLDGKRGIWSGFRIDLADLTVEKSQFSAFFPGSSTLAVLLEGRGIDTVLVTGTVTNICCESSARDAAACGLRVIMVADANAARRDSDHNAALHNIYRSFGDVRTTAEVVDLLRVPAR